MEVTKYQSKLKPALNELKAHFFQGLDNARGAPITGSPSGTTF